MNDLLELYIKTRRARHFGWRKRIEDRLVPGNSDRRRYIELAGVYSALLDNLIDRMEEEHGRI